MLKRLTIKTTHIFEMLLCALLAALCSISFSVTVEEYTGLGATPAATTSYLWTALGICFFLLFRHCFVRCRLKLCIIDIVAGLAFGIMNAFCSELFATDTWQMSTQRLLLTIGKSFGQSIPMMCFTALLHSRFLAVASESADFPPSSRFEKLLDRHPVFPLFCVLFICWLPYLIVFYPGTVCWDLGEMVAAFFGVREWNTLHPVFVTAFLGSLVWIGRLFGSDNLGPFLYMMIQTFVFSWALANLTALCRKLLHGRRAWIAILAFFALTPLFGGYAQYICTDTLYTASIVMFVSIALRLVLFPQANHVKAGFGLLSWGLLCCLMRSNGFALIVISSVTLTIVFLRNAPAKKAVFPIAGMAVAILLTLAFNKLLIPALQITDNSASAIYSVCFQQSARVLRDHADEVTKEEYNAIDAVLDAENLPELYEPAISDPVKYTFRQWGEGRQAEEEALKQYRTVWLQMAAKYPLTYLESFFAGNMSYYTFQPKIDGETYNNQGGARLVFETYDISSDERCLHTKQPDLFYSARILLAAFARGLRHIPGISMLYCLAFYTWFAVAACISILRQKKIKIFLCFMPMFISFAVCLVSPVNDYFRYYLPVTSLLPLLLCATSANKSFAAAQRKDSISNGSDCTANTLPQ